MWEAQGRPESELVAFSFPDKWGVDQLCHTCWLQPLPILYAPHPISPARRWSPIAMTDLSERAMNMMATIAERSVDARSQLTMSLLGGALLVSLGCMNLIVRAQ